MKNEDTPLKGPCEVWHYIGVPKKKCHHCEAWFITGAPSAPEFCSLECFGQHFVDQDSITLSMELGHA